MTSITGNTYDNDNKLIAKDHEMFRDHNIKIPHFIFHLSNEADLVYRNYFEEQKKLTNKLDSGIDCLFPKDIEIPGNATFLVSLGIKVECNIIDLVDENLSYNRRPYIIAPRSSIYKTPLQLANSIGIIDAGYRGTLKAAFRNLSSEPYTIKKGQRLVQLCLPDLDYNYVFSFTNEENNLISLVNNLNSLTDRGERGLGSSGI